MADNGLKGAEGGTHLRNIILSLQNPTDKAAASLQSLGVDVENCVRFASVASMPRALMLSVTISLAAARSMAPAPASFKTVGSSLQSLGVDVYDAQGNMRGLNDVFKDLQGAMAGMDNASKDSMLRLIRRSGPYNLKAWRLLP